MTRSISPPLETACKDQAAAVSPDLQAKLVRFAAGKSSQHERSEIKQLLLQQPSLIPVLVTTLRSLPTARK